jgi:hypothetical protein
LLKNGASSLSSQFSRLPELRSDKGVLTNIKMSGFFESDENSTISQTGQLLIYSAGQVFTAGQEQIVAGAPDDGDKREGPDDTDSGDDNTPTPTPTPTPNVVTLEQLQTAYNNKFKALIDTRCAGCHASRPSKWGSFADVKIFADQGRGRVNDGSMPRGGTLSNTEKTELTQFLDSLAKLP